MHVTFNSSAAKNLREALELLGCGEPVVALDDDFRVGPINPSSQTARNAWIEREYGYCYHYDASLEAFWASALGADPLKVAWFSRRSAGEYAGFLEWLCRMEDAPCQIVDLTDVELARRGRGGQLRHPQLVISLALLSADVVVEHDLFALARPLSDNERSRYMQLWSGLREENAPLRKLEGGQLVSVPISAYDALLLACVTPNWQKMARIVGEALGETFIDQDVSQIGDDFLVSRLFALERLGRIELRGDTSQMRTTDVRLARSGVPAQPA